VYVDREVEHAEPAPQSPEASDLPSTLEFKQEREFAHPEAQLGQLGSCSVDPEGLSVKVRCSIYRFGYSLNVSGGPENSARKTGVQEESISVLAALGKAKIERRSYGGLDLGKTFLKPDASVTVTFANGTSVAGALPQFDLNMAASKLAQDLGDKAAEGFKFSPEEPEITRHSILFAKTYDMDVVGPAKTYGEIDWIATEARTSRETSKMCSGYRINGAGDHSLPLSAEDATVTVRDRRNGQEIATKEFASNMECPSFATNRLVAGPSHTAITAWLKSLLSRK
jgi:hypothetical protein